MPRSKREAPRGWWLGGGEVTRWWIWVTINNLFTCGVGRGGGRRGETRGAGGGLTRLGLFHRAFTYLSGRDGPPDVPREQPRHDTLERAGPTEPRCSVAHAVLGLGQNRGLWARLSGPSLHGHL